MGIKRERGARMNVAVAGGGMVGSDAEGDNLAASATAVGCAQSSAKFSVLEHMVGGEHGDDRLRVMRRHPGGRVADGGGAVAPVRLQQDRGPRADLPQLLSDRKRYSVW